MDTFFFSSGGVFSHRLEMRARSRERCASFKRDIIASRDGKMILTYSTLFYHPNRRASLITPGTQACKALRAEGHDVILVNSKSATIMTDSETAKRTFVTPMMNTWNKSSPRKARCGVANHVAQIMLNLILKL